MQQLVSSRSMQTVVSVSDLLFREWARKSSKKRFRLHTEYRKGDAKWQI